MSDNNQRLDQLATKSVGRLLWEYSLPAVVGMMVNSLYNVIDRIFIGQGVGPEAISGLAITFPVMNMSAALGVLIGAGAAARSSIHLGEKNMSAARQILGNSLTLTLIIGTLYVGFFALFLDEILYAFGATEVTIPYARDFMAYLLPGMLMINLTFSFNNIMRATGYPVRAMVTMIIGAVANIILAPIFIFALDMGIKGAAIATDISMFISMLFVMAHFMKKDVTVGFRRGEGMFRLKSRVVISIFSIGAAPSLVNAAACCINILINRTMLRYGSDLAVGAVGIFSTYAQLLTTFVLGICLGMQPIIGYNYGARRYDRLRSAFYLGAGISTAVTTIGCLVGVFCSTAIARVFTTDPTLLAITGKGLQCAMIAFWVVGFQIVSTTLFQSIGKAWKSIILSLARQVIFLIPLLIWLPTVLGLEGVWYSFPISDAAATIITIILVVWQLRHLSPNPLPAK